MTTDDRRARDEALALAARRRRLAEVFGDDLPDQTRDDLPDQRPPTSDDDPSEEWLRRQVPPHHG